MSLKGQINVRVHCHEEACLDPSVPFLFVSCAGPMTRPTRRLHRRPPATLLLGPRPGFPAADQPRSCPSGAALLLLLAPAHSVGAMCWLSRSTFDDCLHLSLLLTSVTTAHICHYCSHLSQLLTSINTTAMMTPVAGDPTSARLQWTNRPALHT